MFRRIFIFLVFALRVCAVGADTDKRSGDTCDSGALIENAVYWYAPFFSGGGYSSEAIDFALGLIRSGRLRKFKIVQFAEPAKNIYYRGLKDRTRSHLLAAMRRTDVPLAGSIAICHSTPDVFYPGAAFGWDRVPCPPPEASIRIARTMYETDRVPLDWVPKLNAMDEIWVPSAYHVDTFSRSGVDARILRVVPESVDTEIFDPMSVTQSNISTFLPPASPSFTFLSVFKFEPRKNWRGLLRAFLSEFRAEEEVRLVIKTSEFHNNGQAIRRQILDFSVDGVSREELHARKKQVVVITKSISRLELVSLYKESNAFVLPSRGEGWGRPHAEAMAMGLPSIATNFSGNTAFMKHMENSLLIAVEKLVRRDPSDSEGHMWAEPSIDHLRSLMRWCVENRDEAEALGRRARKTMVREFSIESVASRALDRILAHAARG
eukprot:g97.t1